MTALCVVGAVHGSGYPLAARLLAVSLKPAQVATKAVAFGVAFFFVFRGLVMCDSSASLCPLSVGALSGLFLIIAQPWGGLLVHGFSVIRPAQSFNHSN